MALASKVQLLRMQMARGQRRSLHFWHRWAERSPGRQERRRFRGCLQRLSLRRWRDHLLQEKQWQAMNDQA